MRVAVLIVLLVALGAGCVAAPSQTPGVDANMTTPTLPGVNTTLPLLPVGERMPRVVETFALDANHGLTVTRDLRGEMALVAETVTGRALLMSTVAEIPLTVWTSPPLTHPFELDGDIDVVLTFSSDQPAALPSRGFGFPPVGAWLGAEGRYALFLTAEDAPNNIEAGKTYAFHLKGKAPEGGLFYPAGASMGIYPFLAYDPGPGTMSWHVNDANLSAITFGHQHFNVSAPKQTVVAEKTGELAASPQVNPTGTAPAADIAITIPADAVYAVFEVSGTSSAPGHLDVDLTLLVGGTRIQGSNGPSAHETVILGPTQLAKAREYTARVSHNGPPGSFGLKVTAYGPA